jgi:hypothetical protein
VLYCPARSRRTAAVTGNDVRHVPRFHTENGGKPRDFCRFAKAALGLDIVKIPHGEPLTRQKDKRFSQKQASD